MPPQTWFLVYVAHVSILNLNYFNSKDFSSEDKDNSSEVNEYNGLHESTEHVPKIKVDKETNVDFNGILYQADT